MLDICWSYYAYAKKILDAAGAGRVAVVAVPGRVVTGSMNSFALLLDALTVVYFGSIDGALYKVDVRNANAFDFRKRG